MAKRNQLSAAELSGFCSQVALILSAGLPLYDGMETLAEASKDSLYADLYQKVSQGVTTSGSLYEAMQADERWPKYLTEMVGIGEQTGELERVMLSLSDYYSREDRIRSAVVNAVTYPLVLGAMLVVIIAVMLWKVLPVFRQVLGSMGVEMTGAGQQMMNVGAAIGWVVLALVGVVLLAVLVVLLLLRTSARPKVLSWIRRVLPAVRRVTGRLGASRVASVLGMMLASGFPTSEAFRLLPSVMTDEETSDKVSKIAAQLDGGSTLADALSESRLFEALHDRMIRMGVAAGKEDQVMMQLATLYEEQVEADITRLVSIIEPTLIALLSIVIGAILLAVMLPMAGILSSML